MMHGFFTSVPVTNAMLVSAVDECCEIEEPECKIFTNADDEEVFLEDTGMMVMREMMNMRMKNDLPTECLPPLSTVFMMPSHWPNIACQKFPIQAPPPLKCHRLEVPVWVVCKEAWEAQEKKLWEAYNDIQK